MNAMLDFFAFLRPDRLSAAHWRFIHVFIGKATLHLSAAHCFATPTLSAPVATVDCGAQCNCAMPRGTNRQRRRLSFAYRVKVTKNVYKQATINLPG
jgi:hypothetical protein